MTAFTFENELKIDCAGYGVIINSLNGNTARYTVNGKQYKTTARIYNGKNYSTKTFAFPAAGFSIKYYN